jgi:hypothetical protein
MTGYDRQDDRIEDLDVTAEEAERTKGGIIVVCKPAGTTQEVNVPINTISSFSRGA